MSEGISICKRVCEHVTEGVQCVLRDGPQPGFRSGAEVLYLLFVYVFVCAFKGHVTREFLHVKKAWGAMDGGGLGGWQGRETGWYAWLVPLWSDPRVPV